MRSWSLLLFAGSSLWLSACLAEGEGGGAAPAGNRRGGGRFDPQPYRQRMEARVKEQLGSTEEEWKALQPLVAKVQELQQQQRSAARALFGRGRQPQAQAQGAEAPELPALEQCTEALRKLLENPEAKPEEIKEKLDAYRAEVAKVTEELKAAQQALLEGLTQKQEAQMVLMGLLE